jgi:hypothetical protein
VPQGLIIPIVLPARMLTKDFNHTLDSWIKSVEQYNFIQLCMKPSPTSWSLGKVCMHLMDNTDYYIEQIRICLSNDDNLLEEMSANAKTMFHNNDFPDAILEGHLKTSTLHNLIVKNSQWII